MANCREHGRNPRHLRHQQSYRPRDSEPRAKMLERLLPLDWRRLHPAAEPRGDYPAAQQSQAEDDHAGHPGRGDPRQPAGPHLGRCHREETRQIGMESGCRWFDPRHSRRRIRRGGARPKSRPGGEWTRYHQRHREACQQVTRLGPRHRAAHPCIDKRDHRTLPEKVKQDGPQELNSAHLLPRFCLSRFSIMRRISASSPASTGLAPSAPRMSSFAEPPNTRSITSPAMRCCNCSRGTAGS